MKIPLFNELNFISKARLPVIFQSEASECGLACLCMIANYYGYKTDLITLRHDFNISLKGAKLSHLIKIAERLKLGSKAIRIELDDLVIVDKPCILHWDVTHYVILKSATRKKVIILDPALGERVLSWEQVSKSFTGVALEVFPTAKFEKKEDKTKLSLNILWDSIVGLRRGLLQILILALSLNVFTLLIPYFMQLSIDKVVINNDKDLLTVLGIGFLLLSIVKVITTSARAWVVVYLRTTLGVQMVTSLFHRLLKIPLSWFEKRHVGDVLSRFGSLDRINELLSSGFIEGLVDGLMAIITLTVMFMYSVKLALIAMISTLAYFVVRSLYYKPLKDRTEETILFAAKEDSIFLESVRSMQSVKIFNLESTRHSVWQNTYVDWLNSDIRLSKIKDYRDIQLRNCILTPNLAVLKTQQSKSPDIKE
jgi:ATP-binding cassette subfamily B protein RaxB